MIQAISICMAGAGVLLASGLMMCAIVQPKPGDKLRKTKSRCSIWFIGKRIERKTCHDHEEKFLV